jgi:integrase/recombinase XerD
MTRYTSEDVNDKLEKVQNLDYVSERNGKLLEEFISYLRADDNVSVDRQHKYLVAFKTLFQKFVDVNLDEASKRDIRRIVGDIQQSDYSDWTKRDFKVTLKKWFNTYYEDEVDRPDRVKRILGASFMKLSSNVENQTKVEALTPEEIMEMVEAGSKTRNKLLPLFLAETGARIGEIVGDNPDDTVRLKHVELNQRYAEVEFHTLKNNKDNRKLQLTRCVGLFQDWLEKHPEEDNPEAQLFVNIESSGNGKQGDPMTREYIGKILRRLAEKAGVDKPVHPHAFRHTSATNKSWEIDRLMYWHGWNDMKSAKSYIHEDEDRMRKARLAEEGINKDENEGDSMDMKECGRCREKWPPTQKYCGTCSLALDKDAATEVDKVSEAGEKIADEQINGISDEELEEVVNVVQKKMRND